MLDLDAGILRFIHWKGAFWELDLKVSGMGVDLRYTLGQLLFWCGSGHLWGKSLDNHYVENLPSQRVCPASSPLPPSRNIFWRDNEN